MSDEAIDWDEMGDDEEPETGFEQQAEELRQSGIELLQRMDEDEKSE